jgi:hypothetical protein
MELASEALPVHAGTVNVQSAPSSIDHAEGIHYDIIGLNVPGILHESLRKTGFLHFAITTPVSFLFCTAAQIIPPLCLPLVWVTGSQKCLVRTGDPPRGIFLRECNVTNKPFHWIRYKSVSALSPVNQFI